MSDRTGIAGGTLRPCIYFVRARDLYAILAPIETTNDLSLARMVFEKRYKREWMWCEARTLQEVDALQKRLANQEIFEASKRIELNSFRRDQIYKQTGDTLRAQMVSRATTPWERDFIGHYLKLREDKRDKFRDSLLHRNYYIYSRENSESRNTDEVLPVFDGQFERSGV